MISYDWSLVGVTRLAILANLVEFELVSLSIPSLKARSNLIVLERHCILSFKRRKINYITKPSITE